MTPSNLGMHSNATQKPTSVPPANSKTPAPANDLIIKSIEDIKRQTLAYEEDLRLNHPFMYKLRQWTSSHASPNTFLGKIAQLILRFCPSLTPHFPFMLLMHDDGKSEIIKNLSIAAMSNLAQASHEQYRLVVDELRLIAKRLIESYPDVDSKLLQNLRMASEQPLNETREAQAKIFDAFRLIFKAFPLPPDMKMNELLPFLTKAVNEASKNPLQFGIYTYQTAFFSYWHEKDMEDLTLTPYVQDPSRRTIPFETYANIISAAARCHLSPEKYFEKLEQFESPRLSLEDFYKAWDANRELLKDPSICAVLLCHHGWDVFFSRFDLKVMLDRNFWRIVIGQTPAFFGIIQERLNYCVGPFVDRAHRQARGALIHMMCDKELALAAYTHPQAAQFPTLCDFSLLYQELAEDRAFMLSLYQARPDLPIYKDYKDDQEIALILIYKQPNMIKELGTSLRENREFISHALAINPKVFEYVEKSFKDDEKIVREAVRLDPKNITFTSSRLLKDRAFLLGLIREVPEVTQHVSSKFLFD